MNCNKCKPSCGGTLINNIHSEFQAIVIPSSLGTSTTGSYTPKIGAYRNALVSYKGDGNSYLYDDEGYYSLLSNSGATVVTVDDSLDADSINPVENSVVTSYIKALQEDITENTSSISTLSSTVSSLSSSVTANATNIATNTANIATNASAIEDNADDISDLTATVATNTSNISSNSTSISENASAITALKTRMTAAEADIDDLETLTGSTTLSTSASTLTAAINELDTDIEENASSISDLEDRLEDLETTAGQANIIESIKENGTALEITDKTVDITVPTKTSDLENDGDGSSAFITLSEATTLVRGVANDATITIADANSTTLGDFSTNQTDDETITIPASSSSAYGLVITDTEVTENSDNAVTSGAVWTGLAEKATVTTLYTNTNGVTPNLVSLSDSAENYDWLEILYEDSNGYAGSVSFNPSMTTNVSLSAISYSSSGMDLFVNIVTVSGTGFTSKGVSKTTISSSGSVTVTTPSVAIYVHEVKGFKLPTATEEETDEEETDEEETDES